MDNDCKTPLLRQGLDWTALRCYASTDEASAPDHSLWLMDNDCKTPLLRQGLDWTALRCYASTGETSAPDDSLWLMDNNRKPSFTSAGPGLDGAALLRVDGRDVCAR